MVKNMYKDKFIEHLRKCDDKTISDFVKLMLSDDDYIFTAEDVKSCNSTGDYFTINELRGMIFAQMRKDDTQEIDVDLISICAETLKQGLYFNTLDEALKHDEDKLI